MSELSLDVSMVLKLPMAACGIARKEARLYNTLPVTPHITAKAMVPTWATNEIPFTLRNLLYRAVTATAA
jgi:hypothetical protein